LVHPLAFIGALAVAAGATYALPALFTTFYASFIPLIPPAALPALFALVWIDKGLSGRGWSPAR
jgi:hypothetical protein